MKSYNQITTEMIQQDLRYLELLSHNFPTIASASTEIINLEAILNLPKGTEHFLADLHGEYEAFQHVLRNASGAIKRKVNEIFGNTLREMEKKELCTLIYYPEQKLQLVKEVETELEDWYVITLNQLVKVCQNVSSKYTRSKVRKALPEEFSYIIQELLHESSMDPNKQAYINVIISTIIDTHRADDFIVALSNLIQRLTIDSLHILGDIFDRRTRSAHHHGYPVRLSQLRHSMGKPRHLVDGRRIGKRLQHRQCTPARHALWQPLGAGRRLWHQPVASRHIRHGYLCR